MLEIYEGVSFFACQTFLVGLNLGQSTPGTGIPTLLHCMKLINYLTIISHKHLRDTNLVVKFITIIPIKP